MSLWKNLSATRINFLHTLEYVPEQLKKSWLFISILRFTSVRIISPAVHYSTVFPLSFVTGYHGNMSTRTKEIVVRQVQQEESLMSTITCKWRIYIMKLQKRNFELRKKEKKRNLTDKVSTYTSERFTGIMHHSLKVLTFREVLFI